ncbi:MAG TPA: gamma-glutamylcyclotransferase family protein [Candidatus Binatia bacterium]|jgi:cation transport regulator ChaC|nr:gamma-glutamylcyclotransferase family protein [Candidatus Binatia bacterium]
MPDADDHLWYFAYGSNLCPSTFVERRKLAPLEAHCARLDGHALRFDLPIGPGERAVANLEAVPDVYTWGVVYRITPADADRLDVTEGVHRGYYARAHVTVHRPSAADTVAAYTLISPHRVAGRRPSARYLGIILDGARHHGLPAEWIAYLEALELAVDERLSG